MQGTRTPEERSRGRHPRPPQSDKIEASTKKSDDSQALCLGHISEAQVTAMMAFLLGVKALLITPTLLILDLATGAWIGVVISVVVAFIGLAGWLKWSRLTGRLSLLAALQKTMGRLLGTVVCTVLMLSFLLAASLSMRIFAGGAVIGLLPEFPVEILLVTLIAGSAYAAWLGIESVARTATLFYMPTIVSFAIVVIAGLRGHDTRNLLPLFGAGPMPVVSEGVKQVGLWGIMTAFATLKPYVRSEKDLAKGTQKGLLAAGIGLAASVISILMFFPYPASTRLAHPMGILARSVYLGRFVQRIEAVFVFTWFFASALQASLTYFVLLSLLAEVSGTRTYRPFLPALASLSFGIAALPVSILRAGQLLETYFSDTLGPALVALGWILFAFAKVRGLTPIPDSSREGGNDGANQMPEKNSQSEPDED